jgi:hypothetical protein
MGRKENQKASGFNLWSNYPCFFILFAISIFPAEKKPLTEQQMETKPEVIQLPQEEVQKQQETQNSKAETQKIVYLSGGAEIVLIIRSISPKEFDQKGMEFLLKGDADGLVTFTNKYVIDVSENTKAIMLGEEIKIEPDYPLRNQAEFFAKLKF